ncbi:MAG: T9SS type A sorting domain-containing protein [Chlorobi bacterium]|nr:T9SS type A sorting domain-containing protein [Chlorobiota bacterium]
MNKSTLFISIFFLSITILIGQNLTFEEPEISAGAEAAFLLQKALNSGNAENLIFSGNGGGDKTTTESIIASITPIYGVDFDTDASTSGSYHTPPDPSGAAGPSHLVAVNNTCIRWSDKNGSGVTLMRLGKNSTTIAGSFFQPLSPVNALFDPKVIYDQYFDRFVVVALERQDVAAGDPVNGSRILVAVSSSSDPNSPWYFTQINSNISISGSATWADYPGFAVNPDGILITTNQYTYGASGSYKGSRLWVIEKGVGTGGFYDGGTAIVVHLYDPTTSAGASSLTIQPAHMFGPPPPGVLGYLVGYSGLTSAGNEFISAIEFTGTYTAPTFTNTYVPLGNVDNTSVSMPDAPQNGTSNLIDTGDRRALRAVWNNSFLYNTMTLLPGSGPDNGQATAHWVQCAAPGGTIGYFDQGNCGGEWMAVGTYTFYPSIAVNLNNEVVIGFAASASSTFCGAYYEGRLPVDPPGITPYFGALQAGLDYYHRTFGGGRNRWGDYSSVSVDPSDGISFWLFNEFAMARGTTISGEDGRWATAFGKLVDPPFPVELTSFTGEFENGKVALRWTTATETNNKGFEIERASSRLVGTTPRQGWEKIGFVEGAGNSVNTKEYSFVDKSADISRKYSYRLKQIDFNGAYEYSPTIEIEMSPPAAFELAQNYPNPFSKSSDGNSTTTIKYSIPFNSTDSGFRGNDAVNVTLKIYDILGREVATLVNGVQTPGRHSVTFEGSGLSSGIYYYRLQAGAFSETKKMAVLK